MREILIKYNPYKVETTVTIDGKAVKKNSALNVGEKRLQEWVEDLPEILVEECNTKEFHVRFHGTILDYEDLQAMADAAGKQGIHIQCEHIPAKEVADKEEAIAGIFYEIQQGPFDELKQPDVVRAFEIANTKDFPVNVVATMSAGKSTLINALLHQRLMPAKQEACTATITEIKDSDSDHFQAAAYNQSGELLETHTDLTLSIMDTLNRNPEVSMVRAEGDIPFVSSEEVALVLVDTPGPNNSRDPEHKAATYRMLSESSKTVVLYILNATQLAVNDDNNLLNHVAESMRVGGKQSKDRFIFVVNKLDDFKKGEDSVTNAIEKVKKYLEDKGIQNPNIYPASALTALDIRTTLDGVPIVGLSEEELDELDPEISSVIAKVKKMNRNPELHLENYAPLTPSVRGEITGALSEAMEMEGSGDRYTRSEGMKAEALIHTGVIPIEAAIRMYVAKYAKTAKIKNIVDTFAKKLESARSFENMKQEIAGNQEQQEKIRRQIESIKDKLKSGEEAKAFKKRIDKINYDKEIESIADKSISGAQSRISDQISSCDGKKLSRRDAESICLVFEKFSENLQAEMMVKLEDLITNHVRKNADSLLEEYRQRIASLSQDLKDGEVNIDPFELLEGDIGGKVNTASLIKSLTKSEQVKVGEEWVSNTSKKWYKPWTWLQESGHYKNIYENKDYVNGRELAQKFFAPIQEQLYKNRNSAVTYAKTQTTTVKEAFRNKFHELDEVLRSKLAELEACAEADANVEKMIQESTNRLRWLEDIQAGIRSILEI